MKKSLISAVKKLLAKLGAEKIEGNNLVEVIDSGADAIAEAGGGDSVEYVTVTADTTGRSTVYSADKTFSEIGTLISAGKTVYMQFVTVSRGGTSLPIKSLNPVQLSDGNTVYEGIILLGITVNFSSSKIVQFVRLTIGSSDTVVYTNVSVNAT